MPASRFLKYTLINWPNPVCSFYLPVSTSRDDPVGKADLVCALALEVTHRPRQSSGSRGFPLEDVIPGVSYSGLITTHKQTNKQYSCACDSLCHSQFSLKKYYSSWWNWRFRVTTKDFKKKEFPLSDWQSWPNSFRVKGCTCRARI